jgi:hypothetical protein
MLRSRSAWFFSASNPKLSFGGFEGESKQEMYDLLPKNYFPKTVYANPGESFQSILEKINLNSLPYPFIVKPNVGMEGILFRKIENRQHLETYHKNMPADYIIQEFINYPLEIGVFYIRYPQNNSGKITALFSKKFPVIKGDGISTIKEILESEQPEIKEELSKLNEKQLSKILEKDEIFNLSFIGNRYHGATFHDLSDFIDDRLLKIFDNISLENQFYYGRYDIKCLSIEDLKNGINFSILEFNGAGSIPNHIYTDKFSLFQAYKEIMKHWKTLYEISSYNHRSGIQYWSLFKGARYLFNAKKHFRFLKKCESSIVLENQ